VKENGPTPSRSPIGEEKSMPIAQTSIAAVNFNAYAIEILELFADD